MTKLVLGLSVFLTACTDAFWDKTIGTINSQAEVECYSGGQKVFSAKTTGKVASLDGGGYMFRTTDGASISTFADCFIIYK